MNVSEGAQRKNITSTDTSIASTAGGALILAGVFVASASASPTLKFADGSGTIANTFTPIGGTNYWFPCQITGTLTVTVSGTVDCTVFYGPA